MSIQPKTAESQQIAEQSAPVVSGHTPGPWKVERAPITRQLCVMSESTWICGQLQADNHTRIDSAECIANARLIAAAPDLVKALEITQRMIRGEAIASAVCEMKTMKSLGDVVAAALASAREVQP